MSGVLEDGLHNTLLQFYGILSNFFSSIWIVYILSRCTIWISLSLESIQYLMVLLNDP
jgi:hypothetical protein